MRVISASFLLYFLVYIIFYIVCVSVCTCVCPAKNFHYSICNLTTRHF